MHSTERHGIEGHGPATYHHSGTSITAAAAAAAAAAVVVVVAAAAAVAVSVAALTPRVFRGSRRGGWTAESAERATKRGTRGMPTEFACEVRRGRPRKAAEGRGRSRKVAEGRSDSECAAGHYTRKQIFTNGNNALAWCYSPIRDVQQQWLCALWLVCLPIVCYYCA